MRTRVLVLVGALALLALGSQADAETAATPTALANAVLSLPQRKPCDVSLFTSRLANADSRDPGVYPEGSPMAPAAGAAPSEAQVRAQLAAFMPAGRKRAEALRLFDRAEVRAKIAPPSLRAAYAALVGTVGESTIEPFLGPDYVTMRYGGLPAIAAVTGFPRQIVVSRRYEREHFGLLVATVAHEILHHDVGSAVVEEAILNAISALIHLQVLSRHPELVAPRSELVRRTNARVLVWVNSRAPRSPASALIVPGGKGVLPGSAQTAPDFWTYIHNQYKVARRLASVPAPEACEACCGHF